MCPNCNELMEREDTWGYDSMGKVDTHIPACEYLCDNCGFHAYWQRGIKGLVVIWNPKDDEI